MSDDRDYIRTCIDALWQDRKLPRTLVSPGIAALGNEAVCRLVQTITIFDDFWRQYQPEDKPDVGAFDFDGTRVWFKIDDRFGNDIKDTGATQQPSHRLLIIMLADEPLSSRLEALRAEHQARLRLEPSP